MGLESSEKKRLSADEAHEEANMLRVQGGVNPETGKRYGRGYDEYEGEFFTEGRVPTAEDYDKALAEIEELKRAAQENPTKLDQLIHDLIEKGGQGMDLVQRVLGATPVNMPDFPKATSVVEAIKQRWRRARHVNDLVTIFDDAKNQLNFLRAKGRRFGKQEK